MRRIATYQIVLLATTAALGGCYAPELGDTPFRCAPTGKKCPDGYSCDATDNICRPEGARLDAGPLEGTTLTDATSAPSKEGPFFLDGHPARSGLACQDTASEPNNTSDTATRILQPGALPGWQICYPGDVDHYSVDLEIGASLVVKVSFSHLQGDLDAALIDPDGIVIATSRSKDNDEEVGVRTAVKKGRYVIGVLGFANATNSYSLDVRF